MARPTIMRSARRWPFGPREKVPPWSFDDTELRRDGGKRLLERAAPRPPELVSVAADDPVGTVILCSEAGHSRPPRSRARLVALLANETKDAVPLVRLEDLGGAVGRAMVYRDHEVDTCVKVKRDDGLDHIGLVAGQEGHDELQRRRQEITAQAVKRE
jgi:hypothetical protein